METNVQLCVGTGTIVAKPEIKKLQSSIQAQVGPKIAGCRVIKVEAHQILEHLRPCHVALVGDAAGYVTRCSGEGIYFTAKSGQLCV